MTKVFVAILFLSLVSCTNPTGIKAVIGNADSVAVNYYRGNGMEDSVVNMVMLKGREQINKLADYIDAGKTENFTCGYDGSIHFFKNNIVLKDIYFRMNDVHCMHFSFMLDGQRHSTKLSAEAGQFLKSAGKNSTTGN